MKRKNKLLWTPLLLAAMTAVVVLSGCGSNSDAASSNSADGKQETKTLRISFNPGPYSDQFKKGVAPYLEKKGYEITYKEFTDGIQPNVAVANGEIDANVFQHSLYLESINKREKIDLVGVVQVPTPPMGLYSKKHQSLDEIPDGAQVNLPNEPVNMLRALTILKEVGWITLKDNIDPLQTSINDVTSNPHNIKFVPTEPAQGPQALQDVDYAAIQGNFAIANNIKLTTALKLENMTDPFTNIVAVASKNKDKQFVKDIIDGYHSQEFKDYIKTNSAYEGYHLPAYFNE
ncbi:MetQ/NlpA family ABC transporter substrate-binding protein [Paenibacillus stellifer]|uniref:MetQ/NlpA family ABC transporter substrate-binding protein n=1 Tax=Paenibacillus stellifer TaxID=169760 RepID=UPI000A06FE04|nr:MetQ/NlpA family ABC transporter substrate-binding protein [Paenibacillus stellifer]